MEEIYNINYDAITLDDCIQLYETKDGNIILSNGRVECIIYANYKEE